MFEENVSDDLRPELQFNRNQLEDSVEVSTLKLKESPLTSDQKFLLLNEKSSDILPSNTRSLRSVCLSDQFMWIFENVPEKNHKTNL